MPAAALLLASGLALASVAPAPPVIGLLLPPDEPRRESIRRGAELATEEGGARLAVRGRKGAWGSDAGEAALLVEEDGAAALLAPPDGSATHLVLQVSGRTATPVATLSRDGSVTRTAVPWMVRVARSTEDEARAIFEATPAKRWLAFVPRGRAGREATADLKRAAGRERSVEASGPVAGETMARLLRERRPEGVLIWVDEEPAGALVRELRGAGFSGPVAGPATVEWEPGFAVRYRARWGAEPDAAAALAYDGALVLVELLRRGGAEKAFPVIQPVSGATGRLEFDRYGNRIRRR